MTRASSVVLANDLITAMPRDWLNATAAARRCCSAARSACRRALACSSLSGTSTAGAAVVVSSAVVAASCSPERGGRLARLACAGALVAQRGRELVGDQLLGDLGADDQRRV